MKPTRIDNYFKPHNKRHTYFYVDWCDDGSPISQWLLERPSTSKKINFEAEVQWKGMDLFITLGFSGDVGPTQAYKHTTPTTTKEIEPSVVALIKSNLQKCIRRQLVEKALKTSLLFMELDMSTFIRRLSIIMMEDVVLHESFPIIVWLTAAVSKGFVVTQPIKEWLLGVVDYLCRENHESYWTHKIDNTLRVTHELLKKVHKECLDHPMKDTLYSLLLRISYGGMPGDLAMIYGFVTLVREGTILPTKNELKRIDLSTLKPLELGHVEVSAVDFHCYPQIVTVLVNQKRHQLQQQWTEQQIKNAIWHHSSRYNRRVRLPVEEQKKLDNLIDVWKSIKGRLWYLQKDYIRVCENRYNYGQARPCGVFYK